ncbi:MAG: hypothetical protein IKM02_02285 [Clostridia bacterium]|nr:hypothetical protein [Clostridia bacterium]
MNAALLKQELAFLGMDMRKLADTLDMSPEKLEERLNGRGPDLRMDHLEVIRRETGLSVRSMERIFFEDCSARSVFLNRNVSLKDIDRRRRA